jgi:hypothetical protein
MPTVTMLQDWKSRKIGDTWSPSESTAKLLVASGKAVLVEEPKQPPPVETEPTVLETEPTVIETEPTVIDPPKLGPSRYAPHRSRRR